MTLERLYTPWRLAYVTGDAKSADCVFCAAQQNPDADSADIRARKIEPLAVKNPAQHQFGNERTNNRNRRSFITLEDAVEQMAHEQNESNKQRRDVTVVEAEPAHNFSTDYTDSLIL